MPYDTDNYQHINLIVRGNLTTVSAPDLCCDLTSAEQCEYALHNLPEPSTEFAVYLNGETLLPFDHAALRQFIIHAGEYLPSETSIPVCIIFSSLRNAMPQTVQATVAEMRDLAARGIFRYNPDDPSRATSVSGYSEYPFEYIHAIHALRRERNITLYNAAK